MRLLYLGGNVLGVRVLRWLVEQGVEIGGLVLHPPETRRCSDKFLAATDLPADRIFDGSQLRKPEVLETIREVGADMALSVGSTTDPGRAFCRPSTMIVSPPSRPSITTN